MSGTEASIVEVGSIQFKRAASTWLALYNPPLLEGEKIVEIDTNREKLGPVGGGNWNDLPYTDEAAIEAAGEVAAALVAPKLDTADLDATTAAKVADGSSATSAALTAAYATYASLAAQPDSLFVGTIVRNTDGVATSAPVIWPDGTTGVFTALTVNTSWPAVDSYSVTYAGSPARTYTQPLVTRDATSGAVTARAAIVVT